MIRAQRAAHRLLWWVIGPLLLVAVLSAVMGRGLPPSPPIGRDQPLNEAGP